MLDGINYITGDDNYEYVGKDYFTHRGGRARVNLDALEADHRDPEAWVMAIAHALANCDFRAGFAQVEGLESYQKLLIIGEHYWTAALLLDGARRAVGFIHESDRSRLPTAEECDRGVAWLDKPALFAVVYASVKYALRSQDKGNCGAGRLDL